jgi:hypothetical protein
VIRGECQVDPDGEKDMKNKITVLTLGAMLFALCFPAEAQQPKKVPRIGFTANNPGTPVEAFRRGLRHLGYVERKNILVDIVILKETGTVSQACSRTLAA